jgi:uncharacterized protein (TIGR03435 family)
MSRWKSLIFFPLGIAALLAQSRPPFEVASVKPAPKGCPASGSQGRISGCSTLEARIQIAYNLAAFGPNRRQGRRLQILGLPEWAKTDPYEITAKANGDAPPDQMYGPMMQVLLEDRFKLKIHREKREMPVYILTVAKSGLKIKPLTPGSCTVPDSDNCGSWTASPKPNITMDARGETMSDFADDLSNYGSDRVVVDRTGTKDLFNIHLEFSTDTGLSLFTAVHQQLGLRLNSAKAPVEVLVADHIERPNSN